MGTKTIAEANLYDDELFLFSCYGNTAMTGPILGIIWASPNRAEALHRGGAHPEKPFPLGASRLPRLPYRERGGKKYGHGRS